MASYYRRDDTKKARWLVKYRDRSGRVRSQTCVSEPEARKVAAEKTLEEARHGGRGRPGVAIDTRVTVEDYAIREFLPRVAARNRPATLEVYRRLLETYLLDGRIGTRTLGSVRVDQVHRLDLERLLRGLLQPRGASVPGRLSPRTVLLLTGVLAALFRDARRDGLISDNPAHDLRAPLGLTQRIADERDDDGHALSEAQQAQLTAALGTLASPFLAAFVTFGLNTGCRIGEILGLRWQDVDLEGRELHVGWTLAPVTETRKTLAQRLGRVKSGKARRVQVSTELADLLRRLRVQADARALRLGRPFSSSEFVFADEQGQPYDQGNVRQQFSRLLRRAKLPTTFTPHVLRHTFAVELLKTGAPINLVQAQLGHATITLTMDLYGRWVPSSDRSWIDRLGSRMAVSEAVKERIAVGAEGKRPIFIESQIESQIVEPGGELAKFLSKSRENDPMHPVNLGYTSAARLRS